LARIARQPGLAAKVASLARADVALVEGKRLEPIGSRRSGRSSSRVKEGFVSNERRGLLRQGDVLLVPVEEAPANACWGRSDRFFVAAARALTGVATAGEDLRACADRTMFLVVRSCWNVLGIGFQKFH
jgi:hypothetical protein